MTRFLVAALADHDPLALTSVLGAVVAVYAVAALIIMHRGERAADSRRRLGRRPAARRTVGRAW